MVSEGKNFSYKKTTVNLLSQWVRIVAAVFLQFFMMRYILATVGKEVYGSWAAIISLSGFMTVLDSGVSKGIEQQIASYSKTNSYEKFIPTIIAGLKIYSTISVVVIVIGVVLTVTYPMIFPNVPKEIAHELRPGILFVSIAVIMALLSTPAKGTLAGLQMFTVVNAVTISSQVMSLLYLMLGFSVLHMPYVWLGVTIALTNMTSMVLSYGCVLHKLKKYPKNERQFEGGDVKKLLGFASHSFTWSIARVLIYRSSPILSLWFLTPETTAYVQIATTVVQTIRGFVVSVSSLLTPMAGAIKDELLKPLAIRSTKVNTLLSLLFGGGMIMYGKLVIRLWLGEGYGMVYYLCIVGIGCSIPTWSVTPLSSIVIGRRLLRYATFMELSRTAGAIAAGLSLTAIFHAYGLIGGLAAGNSVVSVIGYIRIMCKHLKIPVLQFVKMAFGKESVVAVAIILITVITQLRISLEIWQHLVLHILVSFAVLCPLTFYCIDSGIKKRLRGLLLK